MPRPLRFEAADTWYHVMNRGNNRQKIYTVFFKRKHDKVGHLFQGRYKAIVVDKSIYGLEVTRYIHLNPVRKKSLTDTSIEDKIKLLQSFLGANAFIDSIKAKILENDPECNGRAAKTVTLLPVDTVLEFISQKFDIPVNAIVKRRSKHREIRQASIWLCSNICIGIQSLTEIGRYFGDIKVAGVARIRDRFAKKLSEDPVLRTKYTNILQQLRHLRRPDHI